MLRDTSSVLRLASAALRAISPMAAFCCSTAPAMLVEMVLFCSMTSEMEALVHAFGYGWDDMEWFTVNAMKSSFWPFDQRLTIINQQIKPAYAALRASGI